MRHGPAMASDVLFVTERLSCRRWKAIDVNRVYEVYSDEEGARWVGDGLPIQYEECERWMNVTLANYSRIGYGMFAVTELSTNQTVGFCGLVHPSDQVEAEIKYSFLKDRWGRGYASEVVPAMLSYGATVHGIDRIIATVASENIASQRVLLKSGMLLSHIVEDDDSKTHVYKWSRIT